MLCFLVSYFVKTINIFPFSFFGLVGDLVTRALELEDFQSEYNKKILR